MTYANSKGKTRELAYAFYEDMDNNNVHDKAPEITCSICLIHGDADETVLLEQSVQTNLLLPDSELHILPGVDHFFK
jgi:pimeloyl-ACP methyl ester carboxylesterase